MDSGLPPPMNHVVVDFEITEAEAQRLVDRLVKDGHLVIGEKDTVSYQLERK